jgi:hypothetical protein
MVASIIYLLSFTLCDFAYGGFDAGFKVTRLSVQSDGYVFFGTDRAPYNTCNYWYFYLQFDSNSIAGKQMLATLLTSKATNTSIDLWYNYTTTPGAVDVDCAISTVTGIALE